MILGGTYDPIEIDLSVLSGELTLYAGAGPGATTINGNTSTPTAVVHIYQSGVPGGSVRLGVANRSYDFENADRTAPTTFDDWFGFSITPFVQPGILVDDVDDGSVIINGNRVLGGINGGIRVVGSRDVTIAVNEIADTQDSGLGIGVHLNSSCVRMVQNWVHGCTGSPAGNAQGGGVALTHDGSIEAEGTSHLCKNAIYQNQAYQGCGLFVSTDPIAGGVVSHTIERNKVYENSALALPTSLPSGWIPEDQNQEGYRGGGVAIMYPVAFPGSGYALLFLNNEIYLNVLDLTMASLGYPMTTQDSQGGGLYCHMEVVVSEPIIAGNLIHDNSCLNEGGGVFLGIFDELTSGSFTRALFYSNTIARNNSLNNAPGEGLFLPVTEGEYSTGVPGAPPVPFIYEPVAVLGVNNIIHDNDPNIGAGEEWLAECDPLSGSGFSDWRYNQRQVRTPTFCGVDGYDCFASGAGNSDSPPILQAVTAKLDPLSPACIDDADPLGIATTTDFEGEQRVLGPAPDRGADEVSERRFIRGNCDDSDEVIPMDRVRIDDGIYLQNALFTPGFPAPACLDACDFNDDGKVDISDVVYLYAFLYAGGPPPPNPFPNCGFDSTGDSLPECGGVSCP